MTSLEEEEDSFSIDVDVNDKVVIGKTPVFETKDNALQNLTNYNKMEKKKIRPKSKSSFGLNISAYSRHWKTQRSDEQNKMYQEKFETLKKEWMENLNDLYEDCVPVRKQLENHIIVIPPPEEEKKVVKKSFYFKLISKLKKNKNK